MIPNTLTTIYQQYRHDTDVVASWLVTTGRETGFTKGDLKPPSTRLKGKAREQAKKSDAPQTPAQPPKKFVLPIKLFMPLAEHAAASPSVKTVPVWFRASIERAISVREGFGTRITDQGTESKKDMRFFVDVLIKVKEVLEPKLPEMPKKKKPQTNDKEGDEKEETQEKDEAPKDDATTEATEKMDKLDVKEPIESFLNIPDIEFINPAAEPSCEAEVSDSMDDVLFAFSALVQDTRVLRGRIVNLWSSYLNGTLGLAGVAVATDTCIGLVRQMEASILPLLKKQERHIGQLIQAYYIGICQSAGHDPTKKADPSDDMNFDCYDIGDSTMHNVFSLLRAFRDLINPKSYPAYKQGHCGIYDPTSNRAEKDARGKWTEDKVLLMETLPDLVLLGREILGRHKERDELTRLVCYMYHTRDIPFALVFAAQVFLDVQRVMRAKTAKPFVEMTVFGRFVASTVTEAMEFHSQTPGKDAIWPKQNENVMGAAIQDGKLWGLDPINQFKTRTKLSPPTEPHMLLKRHPIFCGLWLHTHRVLFHDLGIAFANAWGSVLFTGHMYNAILQERLLRVESGDGEKPKQKHWKDMDAAFACQEGCIFVGMGEEYPKSREAIFDAFCKSMGVNPEEWAKDPASKKLRAGKRGARGLLPRGKVSQKFKTGRQGAVSKEAIQAIIDSSDWERRAEVSKEGGNTDEAAKIDNANGAATATAAAGPGAAGAAGATNGHGHGHHHHHHHHHHHRKPVRLSLSALLWQQALALQIETVELSFDYFALHRACWVLLRNVRDMTESDICSLLPGAKEGKILDDETQAVWLVGYLIYLLKDKESGDAVADALDVLSQCADLVRQLIEDGKGGQIVGVLRSHLGLQLQLDEEEEDD